MSRCFPFPPPGYEKKPTTDNIDLLKKEKRKEKKHKDKKDKKKRESKEKRDDKSDRKHKEKKDKHRHRKKGKENGIEKENDKSSISDGQFDGSNGEKLYQKEQGREESKFSADRKSPLQLQSGEYNKQLYKKEDFSKEKTSSLDDTKSSVQFCGLNGEFLVRNRVKAEDIENFKFMQELGRRVRDEEKGTSNHQFVGESRKKSVNRVEIQKTDGQGVKDEAYFGRNAMVRNYTPPPLDKRTDRRIEEKEEMREQEGNIKPDTDKQRQEKEKANERSKHRKAERDKNKHINKSDIVTSNNFHPPDNSIEGVGRDGNSKKRKDMEANGFSHENEPRANKMARPTSSILTETGSKQDFLQGLGTNLSDKQGRPPNSVKMVDSKEWRVNGVIVSQQVSRKPLIPSANHIPSKPTPIKSPPVITNHFATLIPITKPPPPSANHNITVLQPQPISSTKPPAVVANQDPARSAPVTLCATQPLPIPKKKQSMKPPHPDTKYLNQILTVPKLEQWSGFDDQEWLFNSKDDIHFKKTAMEDSLQDKEEVQVWFEAMHIESIDVCALPYVIPY